MHNCVKITKMQTFRIQIIISLTQISPCMLHGFLITYIAFIFL